MPQKRQRKPHGAGFFSGHPIHLEPVPRILLHSSAVLSFARFSRRVATFEDRAHGSFGLEAGTHCAWRRKSENKIIDNTATKNQKADNYQITKK